MTAEAFTKAPERGRLRIMNIYTASDMWIAELARRGRAPRTRDRYRWIITKLGDMYPYADVDEITPAMVRRFLDQWADSSPATSAQIVSILRAFFAWMQREEITSADPAERLERPRLPRPEEQDHLTTLSTTEVQRMLLAADGWTEKTALYLLAYTGSRRRAVAQLRLRDYDQERGELTFVEKGGKTITKPIPAELALVLDAAIAAGIYDMPDDYLVPGEAAQRRGGDRDDRIIWKVVKRVGARVGIDVHVHAFRAAFAVFFLERKPDKLIALQSLLGHSNLETTRVYLRRLDRRRAMEEVRDLSWADADVRSVPASGEGGIRTLDSTPANHRAEGTHPADLAERLLEEARRLAAQVAAGDLGVDLETGRPGACDPEDVSATTRADGS